MFCEKCGNLLREEAKFCSKCGAECVCINADSHKIDTDDTKLKAKKSIWHKKYKSVSFNYPTFIMKLSKEAPEEGIYFAMSGAALSFLGKWESEKKDINTAEARTHAIIFTLRSRYPDWSHDKIAEFIQTNNVNSVLYMAS